MTLKIGISGLRGTVVAWEESLSATTVVRWVQAFVGRLQAEDAARPFVALGHDARRSSPAIAALAKGALLTAGADVLELGLTLTPTLQLAVRTDPHLSGGLMITASHNPVAWNGLKFVGARGFFLPLDGWEAMHAMIERDEMPTVPLDQVGRSEWGGEAAWQGHQRAVLEALPVELIRRQRYRVALDACNSGAIRWAETLAALGCETLLLNAEPHGFFAREAEPLPEHLDRLRYLVRSARCDLGLAADPDGDRLVLVDGQGDAVSEEHTVVLAALALAQDEGERVVINVVTTHALEEALPRARVIRTAVGEMNVVQGTIEAGAVLGGEGSGGIIVPTINLARDGLAAAGVILKLMAERREPLHQLVARIPRWDSVKSKLVATQGSPDSLRTLFARWYASAPIVRLDPGTLHLESPAGSLSLTLHEGGNLHLVANTPGGDTLQ
ncbi:MAG: hypothetical protein ACRDIB_17940, partial [Ardenticatenaceae bacterium]